MMLLKRPHESTEPEPCLYRPARRRCRRISDTPALLSLTRSHLRLHLQPAKATSKPSLISAAPTVKQQHSVSILITSLPSELLLQIFSYLPFIDSIRSSQTCRKFHSLTHDPSLTSHLDLSGFPLGLYPHLPTYLFVQLQTCRSLTLNYSCPSITTLQPVSPVAHIFHEASLSLNLTSLTLRALPKKHIPTLYRLFSDLKSTQLTHIDLARTHVPDRLLSLIVTKHGHSLVSLHLEFAAITDYALEVLARGSSRGGDGGCPVPKLRHLGLAGCLSISKFALRAFLLDSCPLNIDSLDLRWEMDISVYWVDDWLSRKHCNWQQEQQGKAATRDGASLLKARVDLRGCEMVTEVWKQFLRKRWSWAPAVEFRFTEISQVEKRQQWNKVKVARWWRELERRVQGAAEV